MMQAYLFIFHPGTSAQLLRLPDGGVNYKCMTGRQVGVTDITIHYNSPGVKGREGKIWGTNIAPYGFEVLGFGSDKPSPWRAGANESTTISFSTDVTINGKFLNAGTYGFFIAVYPDSSLLIFNKTIPFAAIEKSNDTIPLSNSFFVQFPAIGNCRRYG